MTEIIVFTGRKGGNTKSTLTGNIAAGLAIAGFRVVAIESDGQGSLSRMMRIPASNGLYELLANDAEWNDVLRVVPVEFAGTHENLSLLPSSDMQMDIENADWVGNVAYERFQELRSPNVDFVLIDTPPGIHNLNSAFHYIADWMILPTLCERPSIDMLHLKTLGYIADAQAEAAKVGIRAAQVLGIVPNRFDARKSTSRTNVGFIQGKYGDQFHIFDPIRELAAWGQAAQVRRSIFTYANDEKATDHERKQSRVASSEITPVIKRVLELAGVAV